MCHNAPRRVTLVFVNSVLCEEQAKRCTRAFDNTDICNYIRLAYTPFSILLRAQVDYFVLVHNSRRDEMKQLTFTSAVLIQKLLLILTRFGYGMIGVLIVECLCQYAVG